MTNPVDGELKMFGLTGEQHDADFQSSAFITAQNPYFIDAYWTEEVASLAGTIKLQASADNTNWRDIPETSQVISGAGNAQWNVRVAKYFYVRIAATISSGTIEIFATLNSNRRQFP